MAQKHYGVRLSSGSKRFSLCSISDKDTALDAYEKMLRESLAAAGVDFDSYNDVWPTIFERFRRIGNEVAYRTVYAALCSQAHNDPEEILNSIMCRVGGREGMAEANFVERYHFALYMVLTAIQYHLLATALYLAKYAIPEAQQLMPLHKRIGEHIKEIATNTPDAISSLIKEAGGTARSDK